LRGRHAGEAGHDGGAAMRAGPGCGRGRAAGGAGWLRGRLTAGTGMTRGWRRGRGCPRGRGWPCGWWGWPRRRTGGLVIWH